MWLDDVGGGARALARIYGGTPDISDVYLHEAILHQDGPELRLRFDLKRFPASPPADWSRAGYNVVQVTYGLSGLRSVRIEGFATENHVRLSIGRDAGRIRLATTGATRIEAEGDDASIRHLAPHRRDPPY